MSEIFIKKESTEKLKEQLKKTGVVSFTPTGNSMWPTIKNGSQSVIIEKKTGRLKKYDVALYERMDGSVVLHRVVDLISDGYVFCGDSQTVTVKVKEEDVIGVMTGYYRGKKFIYAEDKKEIKRINKWFSSKFIR